MNDMKTKVKVKLQVLKLVDLANNHGSESVTLKSKGDRLREGSWAMERRI